ncbi:MAG: hypothetical protein FWF53_04490 [Candidatus Azobacteroides sp.]|nr:hypothetical protein [Candidatus Azobacteroides sp.]
MAKKTENVERKVKGKEPVVIEYLEGAKFNKPGTRTTVHRVQADNLIEKKAAKEVKEV